MAFLSVKAKPELEKPHLWKKQPKKLYFYPIKRIPTGYGRAVDEKHIRRLKRTMESIKEYLADLGFEILESGGEAELKIHIFASWKDPEFERGISFEDTLTRSSTVILNMDTVNYWIVGKYLRRILLIHELGHSLGLVATATESAEEAGVFGASANLNHCRHLRCAMTHTRLASWVKLGVAFLFGGAQQTFCKYCERYLKDRLDG